MEHADGMGKIRHRGRELSTAVLKCWDEVKHGFRVTFLSGRK